MSHVRINLLRAALIAAAGLLAATGYLYFAAPERHSVTALAAAASVGVLIGALVAAAWLPGRRTDAPKLLAGAIFLIVATTALPAEQPAWLDAARAVAVVACAAVAIHLIPIKNERRRPALLLVAGLLLGGVAGIVLLA